MCTDGGVPGTFAVPPVRAAQSGPSGELGEDRPSAGEIVPLRPVDAMSVTTVCDNSIDIFLPDQGPAQRLLGHPSGPPPTVPAATLEGGRALDAPLAQHGLSLHVTVTVGNRTSRLLFDTGITPDGCVDNMRRIGLPVGDVQAIICSHGHFDHTTGLAGLVDTLGRSNLPVILHPDFWARRRLAVPGGAPLSLPATSRSALEGAGFQIVEGRHPSFLVEDAVLITGEVDRTSGFETGFRFHEAERDGVWQPDPLILDDQALIVHVEGRGLVIITGCGHAGIVNIVRYAQRLTGVDRVYAVLGGFHLGGPLFEPLIDPTVDALAAVAPEVIVPAHCTGWRATHALAHRLPDAFIPNSVGTTFRFTAQPVAGHTPTADPGGFGDDRS